MSKILLTYFVLCLPQFFLTTNSFDDKIRNGVCVVEFWAEWNKKNEVTFLGELQGCKKYRLNIIEHSGIQKRFEIFSVPTILIFKDGELKHRYCANIMMQLQTTQQELQDNIDKLNR